MNIEDKLRSIITIKNQIKTAIANKGVIISDSTPFSEYPSKINSIIYGEVDTKAPIVEYFDLVINSDRSATFTGKSEKGAIVILRKPDNSSVPVILNTDGSFLASIAAPAMEGLYTLVVSDAAGNATTSTKQLTLPVIPVDSITKLFTTGTEGAYYDINDLTTLFQDSSGTIPVTAVGQTIGLIKDKSGNKNNLIQPTVSRQPKLTQDALTGAYGLVWDGVDDFMYASIPALVSTTVQFLFSQKFLTIENSTFNFYLSDTPSLPTTNRGVVVSTSYDSFFSAITLLCYRNSSLARKGGITSLRNIFGGYHANSELLNNIHNKQKSIAQNATYVGTAWIPNPNFIGVSGAGVTYKMLLIGKKLTDAEILAVSEKMNTDVRAW